MSLTRKTLQGVVFLLLSILLMSCSEKKQTSIIGDLVILDELDTIFTLAMVDEQGNVALKASDLYELNKSVAIDPIASHYTEELYYMIAHNGSEHIDHNLDFLRQYLTTGEKYPCTPHELWHATLYIKNNDFDLVPHAANDASASLNGWILESEAKQKKFPQFYLRLDEQIAESQALIEALYNKNYSEPIVERLNYLGETASC